MSVLLFQVGYVDGWYIMEPPGTRVPAGVGLAMPGRACLGSLG